MNRLAAAVILALAAAPLAAQRGAGSAAVPRAPGTTGFPRPGFLDPGVIERRPVLPAHIGPIPFPPQDGAWVRADTAHFILFGATGEYAARMVAHDLEKLTSLLTRTNAYFRAPAARTRVFLFAERRIVQPYFDAVGGARVDASGITLRHLKGSTMLIDTTARGGGGLTPRHELVHDLIHRDKKPLPLWIEEGLAEYYSNAGLPIREHASRLRGRLRMPLPRMFAAGVEDPRAWTFDYYAQSWAAVAALMRRDRAAFWEMLHDIDAGRDTAAAIEARYGLSLRALEIAMRKAAAPAESLLVTAAQSAPVEVRPIALADILLELGELLARVKGREADAERHLRAALDANAKHGAARLAYAELLLSMPRRLGDAREQAQSALDFADANETRAHAVIGLSYIAEGDPGAARPYLERALDGAPERLEVAYSLFKVYIAAGERERADAIFARLSDSPRGYDARKLLLDTDIPRADALARDGRLFEAAQILRDLAPKMPEKARANLETQAARLESLAPRPQ